MAIYSYNFKNLMLYLEVMLEREESYFQKHKISFRNPTSALGKGKVGQDWSPENGSPKSRLGYYSVLSNIRGELISAKSLNKLDKKKSASRYFTREIKTLESLLRRKSSQTKGIEPSSSSLTPEDIETYYFRASILRRLGDAFGFIGH